MNDTNGLNFELPILLKNDDLDIRELAAKNQALTVGHYFSCLHKFINQAPFITDALSRVTAQTGDKSDYQMIADFGIILEDISCKKLIPQFNNIAENCKKGNKLIAASGAKQITSDFDKLAKRIALARKIPKTESLYQVHGSEDTDITLIKISNINQPLKLVLEQLEKNELTRKLRVLVVDDAPVIIKTISVILNNDYKVYGITDPAKLEKFLQQITPELFLLDYKMPTLNGFELIPIIRSFKEHKNTPIIFLTSMGTPEHVSAAVTLGACDFLVKPVQPDIILKKVAKHIVRKKLL